MEFTPIGIFRCDAKYAYDVPRQGILAGENVGRVELAPGMNFEAALDAIEGFSRIWLIFAFDRNEGRWRPKVQPPRHIDHKVGVFATRSPYRPNPIGLSCVELLEVKGRVLVVKGHDLLDGTPILDVKPYLPYADSFPDAAPGWTAANFGRECVVTVEPQVQERLDWLAERGFACIGEFIREQLGEDPLDGRRHRLDGAGGEDARALLAYRTWRIGFQVIGNRVHATSLHSGYSEDELAEDSEDRYGDKALHREFKKHFRE